MGRPRADARRARPRAALARPVRELSGPDAASRSSARSLDDVSRASDEAAGRRVRVPGRRPARPRGGDVHRRSTPSGPAGLSRGDDRRPYRGSASGAQDVRRRQTAAVRRVGSSAELPGGRRPAAVAPLRRGCSLAQGRRSTGTVHQTRRRRSEREPRRPTIHWRGRRNDSRAGRRDQIARSISGSRRSRHQLLTPGDRAARAARAARRERSRLVRGTPPRRRRHAAAGR